MTTTKQTPKQIVTDRIEGAYLNTREDGRKEIRRPGHFDSIGDSATTPAGAWKNAADHLAYLDTKQKQAEEFNRQASAPTPTPTPTPLVSATKAASITRKEKERRRAKNRAAKLARRMNRKRAA